MRPALGPRLLLLSHCTYCTSIVLYKHTFKAFIYLARKSDSGIFIYLADRLQQPQPTSYNDNNNKKIIIIINKESSAMTHQRKKEKKAQYVSKIMAFHGAYLGILDIRKSERSPRRAFNYAKF